MKALGPESVVIVSIVDTHYFILRPHGSRTCPPPTKTVGDVAGPTILSRLILFT